MAFSNIRYSTKDVNIAKSGYKALGLVGSGCGDAVNNILTTATFNGTNTVSFVMLRTDNAAYTGNVNVNYQILYVYLSFLVLNFAMISSAAYSPFMRRSFLGGNIDM